MQSTITSHSANQWVLSLIKIHQFHTRLERQSPRQGAAEQIVDVHLKIGDEKTERKVEQLLIEERIKERKAQGFG